MVGRVLEVLCSLDVRMRGFGVYLRKMSSPSRESPVRYAAGSGSKAAVYAGVAELVDAPDLGSGAARRGGSSPFTRTKGLPEQGNTYR